MKKNLTTWEVASIITGYGVGAGVLSMPYLAEKNGFISATLILIAAFRPCRTYYAGKAYEKKKGIIAELIGMLLTPPKKI